MSKSKNNSSFKLAKAFRMSDIPHNLAVKYLLNDSICERYHVCGETPMCKWFMERGALKGESIYID